MRGIYQYPILVGFEWGYIPAHLDPVVFCTMLIIHGWNEMEVDLASNTDMVTISHSYTIKFRS